MMPLPGIDPVSLLLILLGMAALPFAAMVVTSYAKIVVVLGLLRNAIGVQQVPPNMVLNGIALIVSCYIMAPIIMDASNAMGLGRVTAGQATGAQQMRTSARSSSSCARPSWCGRRSRPSC